LIGSLRKSKVDKATIRIKDFVRGKLNFFQNYYLHYLSCLGEEIKALDQHNTKSNASKNNISFMNGTLKTKQKEKISKYFYKTKMGGDSFMA